MYHYELATKGYGFFFDFELIEKKQTKFQEMIIGNSPVFGKFMILDNFVQIAEHDEHSYHEPIAHYPLCMHSSPKKILILGGGDGCLARELAKHDSVERIVMVDIDGEVVEAAKKYFSDIIDDSFADKRLEVVIGDAKEYVKTTKEKFDVIFMDLVDPAREGKSLYIGETLKDYKNVLNEGGIIITHAQSISPPNYSAEKLLVKMRRFFKYSHLYLAYMQSFNALWSFAVFSDGVDFHDKHLIDNAKKKIAGLMHKDMRVVNPEYFDFAYYLPPWAKKKIEEFEKNEPDFSTSFVEGGYKEKIL